MDDYKVNEIFKEIDTIIKKHIDSKEELVFSFRISSEALKIAFDTIKEVTENARFSDKR